MRVKNAVNLSVININKIVVSNKIKGNNETSKHFIGYLNDVDNVITPVCIILPQMSGYIKYFDVGGKNMSFKINDDAVYVKYNQIWNKIKELLCGVKFYSEPIYDDSYIKIKVKTFSDSIKTLFSGDEIPRKNNYPQVYLEQCKYKIKKREIKRFIDDYEIDLDSDYESD